MEELGLTPANVDDYEATEVISRLIVPFTVKEEKVYQTAAWMASLHENMRQQDERYQAHVRAFWDIFARLPAQGQPKHIATTYHQLEQLARELDETALASLDFQNQEVIQAVNRVHDDLEPKVVGLR